jgi:hypothetical protein
MLASQQILNQPNLIRLFVINGNDEYPNKQLGRLGPKLLIRAKHYLSIRMRANIIQLEGLSEIGKVIGFAVAANHIPSICDHHRLTCHVFACYSATITPLR